MSNPVREIGGKKLYKVTDANGEAYNGGSYRHDLPRGDEPGGWTSEVADPRLCSTGYHLTTEPVAWYKPGCRIFEAEGVDVSDFSAEGAKVVCSKVRLTREVLGALALAAVRVFTEGSHEVRGDTRCIATGSAHVEAWDSAHVEAWDSAHVVARGSATCVVWSERVSRTRHDKAVFVLRFGDTVRIEAP